VLGGRARVTAERCIFPGSVPATAVPPARRAAHVSFRSRCSTVPRSGAHHIENTGDTTLRLLEIFRSDRFADVSLRQWMARTPPAADVRRDPAR
jgi:oxalate decarboxylase/phosphoglucose isomerase-like protein (cupin superfamily)